MSLSELSVRQLAELIRAASAELSARLEEPNVERVKAERPVIVLREPPEDDKDFLLRLKSRVTRGEYATAAERARVAALAADYGPWIQRQGLPTERGTGAWRKLADYASVKPARER